MGVSLGGSIATNLAVEHNSKALALISSVDSIKEEIMANLKVTQYSSPIFIRDHSLIFNGQWSPDRCANETTLRLLHGLMD